LSAALSANGSADSLSLVQKVENRYATLKDLKMKFNKEVRSEIFQNSATSEGEILLKQPDKFRLESSDQIVVSNGKTIWTYSKEHRQVTKQSLSQPERLNFLSFLKDIQTYYQAKNLGTEVIEARECHSVALTPKQRGTDFEKLLLWIDSGNYLVKKMEIHDLQGSQTVFWFSSIKKDSKLKDERFEFEVPEDAELIDLTG
jgi:outer membrane lipoprotein carrier protein